MSAEGFTTGTPVVHDLGGSHRDVGGQHGTLCREAIAAHLDMITRWIGGGEARDHIGSTALGFRSHVKAHAAWLDDEITGIAEGADIDLADAYLLQLRAEVESLLMDRQSASECTTFALLPEVTGGEGMIGQNVDLPTAYTDLLVVLRIKSDDQPDVLQLTMAGQVSYIGINAAGLGVFANFLASSGWRSGFPRYLLSRVALAENTVQAAVRRLTHIPRASSRNIIMLDGLPEAVVFENTVDRHAFVHPDRGRLTHTNHYVAPELLDAEMATDAEVGNSIARLSRIDMLIEDRRGSLDVEGMQAILRDRTLPDALSRLPGEGPEPELSTVASVVAIPALGQLHVALGPPSHSTYHRIDM